MRVDRTAINLYSVRELDEPLSRIVDRVADAGYDGVQFSGGLRDATAEEAREMVEATGLNPAPAHVGIGLMEDDVDVVVEDYCKTIGVDALVVPWLPPEDFADEDAVDATIDRLNELDDALADRGVDLCYHNHDQEFTDVGDDTAFDRLLDQTDLGLELDVGWVAASGADPVETIERVGSRGDEIIHLKDMDVETRTPVEIGTGDVDIQACADAARDIGVEWLTYEHDYPEDPAASIDHGAAFLRDL